MQGNIKFTCFIWQREKRILVTSSMFLSSVDDEQKLIKIKMINKTGYHVHCSIITAGTRCSFVLQQLKIKGYLGPLHEVASAVNGSSQCK